MKPLFTEYTVKELRELFGGVHVTPILPYAYKLKGSPEDMPVASGSLSVSGAQMKLGMVVDQGVLRLAGAQEQSTHILKPCPQRFVLNTDVPANEEFCMRVCRTIFRFPVAAATLCFFQDGFPAYLTKRFDILPEGAKLHMEDFASLMNMQVTGSSHFKYEGSYEQIAVVLKEVSSVPLLDLRRFVCMVLANYLLCNGDAHAKNFSMLGDSEGGFSLAPVYDVLNTHVHVNDSPFAMSKGLFEDGRAWSGKEMHRYFYEWAVHLGLSPRIVEADMARMLRLQCKIEELLRTSWLSQKARSVFLYHMRQRFAQFK